MSSRWYTPDHLHLDAIHIEAFEPRRHRGLYHGIRVLNCDLSDCLLGFFGTRPSHTLSYNFLSLGQYCARSPAKCLGRGKCQVKVSVFSEEITSTSHIVIQLLRDWESGWLPVNKFLAAVSKNAQFVHMSQRIYMCFVHLQQLTTNFLGCGKNLHATIKPRREQRHSACFLYP